MNQWIVGNARFTAIADGVIRMEYAKNAAFADGATLFANRPRPAAKADYTRDGNIVTIATKKYTLTYHVDAPFTPENLSAKIHTGNMETTWKYADKSNGNLGGTLATLDGVDGHRPLPDGLLSRDGWYVIDDSGTPVFADGWLRKRSEKHLCDLYLFAYGHDYPAVLRDLAFVSGKMALPRKYTLGSWYSRWWRYSAEQFLQIVDEYDANDFPLDILVMDMDWHYQDWGYQEGDPHALYGYGHAGGNLGWTGYTWNRREIPDPEWLLTELHRRGIAVTLNDHPADGIRDHEETYPSFMKLLQEKQYKEEVPHIPDKQSARERENPRQDIVNYRFNAGSRDYMDAFFESTHTQYEKMGVDFWWLDWQQDYLYPNVNGLEPLTHLPWLNYLYYNHSQKNGLRGMSFSRWGGFGDHKHPAYFSGDTISTWDTLAFEIYMTVSAGNAGCFWWSHDIGGFEDPSPEKQSELYVRWVQFGITSAALRLHVCGNEKIDRRPWTWGEPYCSAMREMFHLRSMLIPYLYSIAYESYRNSVPMLRPLYLFDSENQEAYNHPTTYYLGEAMLASPVCNPGETGTFTALSQVYLPAGVWYDYFTGARYDGGQVVSVQNDLYSFPLFVKAGKPLPMQPYTSRMTTTPLSHLIVKIFAGEQSLSDSFTLFEDDGVTEGYISGAYRATELAYTYNGKKCTFSYTPTGNGYAGECACRTVTVELYDITEMQCTHAPAGAVFTYDLAKRCGKLSIPAISTSSPFSVTLTRI
ncbi:MAG: DUF5110 domain-containing protein [Clostridiales bacterium]|jgi:alpha-glucosidase (family GH31 glycosyl hydrolase)|nr:DUF5110 domain-containing protein [Clostridiales bacterium]